MVVVVVVGAESVIHGQVVENPITAIAGLDAIEREVIEACPAVCPLLFIQYAVHISSTTDSMINVVLRYERD